MRLLSCDQNGRIGHHRRGELADLLRPGDVVIGNDAATIPASLFGTHVPTGEGIEVRLAGRASLTPSEVHLFSAIVFGAGDFHQRTEDRPPPPVLDRGDVLQLGPLRATVLCRLNHPRLIALEFRGSAEQIWQGMAEHGRVIQYAHTPRQLSLWDMWTPIAGPPVAFEPPSAGFVLNWAMLDSLRARGIGFATITHAAGISSTGDIALDQLLPFDEPYRVPAATADAIHGARSAGGRVVAIGTTVVRALEHAASSAGAQAAVSAGEGIANQKIGPSTRLRVVNALVSGVHEPGTSHHNLLGAFLRPATLAQVDEELARNRYRNHEFGDSIFIEAET